MPRILFVSQPGITHAAQWVSQLHSTSWDVHFFPSHDNANYLDCFNHLTIYSERKFTFPRPQANVRVKSLMPVSHYRSYCLARRLFPKHFDLARWLAHTIDKIQPDLIHSMEMQRGAYLVDSAREFLQRPLPPWIVTPWGSDLYLYRNLASHVPKLKSVLEHCDYFWAECRRDYRYATELGFKGKTLPIVPASGGYETKRYETVKRVAPSKRKSILLKGYQGLVGRATCALAALERCQKELSGYSIILYLSSPDTDVAAELFSKRTGIPVETVRFPRPHEEIQSYFARSRIHLGISISDGLPTSVIEAMAMGTIPIQSDSSCAHEWIQDGVNGFLVPAEDPAAIAEAIRRALTEDALVDQAAQTNYKLVSERLDYELIRAQVLASYESLITGRQHEA